MQRADSDHEQGDGEAVTEEAAVDRMTAQQTVAVVVALGVIGCATMRLQAGKLREGEEHLIVDCLLPPRMINEPNLGAVPMPRPPLKTTAGDCIDQGGDYDADDPRWPLVVWRPAAEQGDPEAQYHVGEIYERGGSTPPDYENAARWYRLAADQHHRPAAANLARLYERGLGVPADWAAAVAWYQRAGGVDDPAAVLEQTRAVLERMDARRRTLRHELERLERRRSRPRGGAAEGRRVTPRFALAAFASMTDVAANAVGEVLQAEAGASDARAEQRVREILEELRTLQGQSPRMRATVRKLARELAGHEGTAAAPAAPDPARARQVLGRYYGLVIGNANYLEWPRLDTPINDARALRDVLEQRYGFEKPVRVVEDGKAQTILDALDDIRRHVNAEAARGAPVNVMLFYAGHGAHRYPIHGHWIPIDGPREFSSRWIADTQIAEQLRAMKARQVLVIADSCYASTLAARGVLLEPRPATLEDLLAERPRMVLASGGDHPVYERHGAEHSVFARALIDVLRTSHGIVRGDDLFRQLEPRVREDAARLGVEQRPEYLPLLDSDHESGDFVLVARD